MVDEEARARVVLIAGQVAHRESSSRKEPTGLYFPFTGPIRAQLETRASLEKFSIVLLLNNMIFCALGKIVLSGECNLEECPYLFIQIYFILQLFRTFSLF